ncbi:MAG: DUF421 domain-containing protein [Hyphomonadaceae bacterium]|nr:DUF421 domain-containing protein [Clostridia bacterium]
MFIAFFRTIILYICVITALRLMGKRQIGELQPSELVVAIMISELAAIPMGSTNVPLINGILPIATLIVAEISLSYISLKSKRFRSFVCGTPSILIENGRIRIPELEKLRFNMDDLLEELRIAGFPNIADVEFAVLETSGKISVIPKSQKMPLTAEDLHMPTAYVGMPLWLINNGIISEQNLSVAKLDKTWLLKELGKQGIKSFHEVFFASLDTKGTLFVQRKDTPE